MHRRDALLSASAVLAGLAGCVSGDTSDAGGTDPPDGDDPGTTAGTATPGDTATPSEYTVGSVELGALLPAVVETTSPDSIGVEGGDTRQYLYLTIGAGAEGDAPPIDEFAFALGGTEYDPKRYDNEFAHWRTGDGSQYAAADGEGWVLFELPATPEDAGGAALRWPGGEWTPEATLRERLAAPQPPTSVSVSVPGTVAAGEQPTITVTITNEGDLPAGVPIAINRVGPRVAYAPLKAGRPRVPPGETTTWEWTDGAVDLESGGESATYHVHWHAGDVSHEVAAAE